MNHTTPKVIEHYFKEDFKSALSTIIQAFPLGVKKLTVETGKTYEQYDAAQTFHYKFIETNMHRIYLATSSRVAKYLNDYGIETRRVDEYKVIYFMGMAIAHMMEAENSGLAFIQMHLLGTFSILDARLHEIGCFRPSLTKNITKLIVSNELQSETGKTGLYLTYKCLSNFSKEIEPNKKNI